MHMPFCHEAAHIEVHMLFLACLAVYCSSVPSLTHTDQSDQDINLSYSTGVLPISSSN